MKTIKERLVEIEDEIDYIIDGYYAPCVEPLMDLIRELVEVAKKGVNR